MKSIFFNYESTGSSDFLTSFGIALGVEPINNSLYIPSVNGSGVIFRKEIDKGMLLVSSDMRLTKNLSVTKKRVPFNEQDPSFTISYFTNNWYLKNESAALAKIRHKYNHHALFYSENAELQFEVPAGELIRSVSIVVNYSWIKKYWSNEDAGFLQFLRELCQKPQPVVLSIQPTASLEHLVLHEPGSVLPELKNEVSFKFKVFSLVADFFSEMYRRNAGAETENRMIHYEKMREVETILKQYLENKLPDTETIARQVALSASTLKRHFKTMFAKNIYEYYLGLKMEHARHLITEKPLSVNEVAYMLGYEKASNFIDIFKRHHGFSPGSLKKRVA